MAEQQYGPRVTVTRSCDGCKACEAESYRCQGDSGIDYYCAHPVYEKRRPIGIFSKTPDWCPAPPASGVALPAATGPVRSDCWHPEVGRCDCKAACKLRKLSGICETCKRPAHLGRCADASRVGNAGVAIPQGDKNG